MKNSPENVLKKMYTNERRSWFNDCGFEHTTSLPMTHVVPDAVIPLTGNTTVKLDLEQYLLTDSTPTAVFETLRVDTSLFFLPQRLYTRGIYGDNITESQDMLDLPLPRADLRPENVSLVSAEGDYDEIDSLPLILRGSLLNRLGCPPAVIIPDLDGGKGCVRPLNRKHLLSLFSETVGTYVEGTPYYVNYALIAGYYDICRLFYANKFEDKVPVARPRVDMLTGVAGDLSFQGLSDSMNVAWHSLAQFGRTVNLVRGVLNGDETFDQDLGIALYLPHMMYGRQDMDYLENKFIGSLKFGTVELLDRCLWRPDDAGRGISIAEIVGRYESEFSNTGLWPNRYDSHYQTMFFKPEDIEGLMRLEVTDANGDGTVLSYRLAQSKFTTTLKSLLRGRTTADWIDVQFGNRLKMHDKPIYVGGDSFILNFQQIVATAESEGIKLGDTGGRGVGGSKRAFDEKGVNTKTITFTTQEPGYLMVLVRCTPNVAYGDIQERFHEYDTLGDFPLPSYSGKIFQPLRVKNLVFTGTKFDDLEIGSQPYGFDYMTNYNRVSGLYGSELKSTFVFKRDFDLRDINNATAESSIRNYLKSVYVEPHTFDDNFNDTGVNAYHNFTLKSAYNLRLCMPLEKQLTNYDI